MANVGRQKNSEAKKQKILCAAAKLFLKNGYTQTKISEIATKAGVSGNTIFFFFESKEGVLADLVKYVLEGQFRSAKKLLENVPHDSILFYAAETTLQLYMVESNERIRDLYTAAYSMPKTTDIIQNTITEKLERIFKEHLPELETKDFFKLEIASGGIMRGFMSIPCNMWFTMKQKIESFLECTFKLYDVPQEKIAEAIQFVSQFDFVTIAQEMVDNMLKQLEESQALLD